MDDISRALGISKKTLYKYFKNKPELVDKVLMAFIEQDRRNILNLKDKAHDAIDEMLLIAKYFIELMSRLSETTVYDLRKYYPALWTKLETLNEEFIWGHILKNIRRGQEEGYYRIDINPVIISRFFASNSLVVSKMIGQKIENIPDQVWVVENVKYHIRGIASEKGKEKLIAYTNAT